MYVYTCAREYDAMLTCIYVAWASGKGHENIRLELEPFGQYSLFDEYTHVDADSEKAEKVMDAVNRKISPRFYSELAYTSMAYEDDILDNMYRMMLLGFTYGESALYRVNNNCVLRHQKIRKRLGTEICHFQEFTRFHEIEGKVYVAHIEPQSKLIAALGPIFEDRMPSENWMIVDDVHNEAVIHPKNERFYIRILTEEEKERLLNTERISDEYTDMWKVFFDSIAIKERMNEKCQKNHFPLWTRKHVVEFTQNDDNKEYVVDNN